MVLYARGTVTSASGYIYENISAIELAYVMDDDELIRNVLWPAIQKLAPKKRKEIEMQLKNKIAEIKEQGAHFKPYNFGDIVRAIAADSILGDEYNGLDKPDQTTLAMLEKFKNDFKADNIKQGKSWIKENLKEAYRVYGEILKLNQWGGNRLRWYLHNVISFLQTRVENCFKQECSQGLNEIINKKKANVRDLKIKSWFGCDDKSGLEFTYNGADGTSFVHGKHFFVNIFSGSAGTEFLFEKNVQDTLDALENYFFHKKVAMAAIEKQFEQQEVSLRKSL